METLPRIFDEKAQYIEPDRSRLPPAVVQQLDRVKRAYTAVREHEAAIANIQERLTKALSAVGAAEKLVAPFGPYDFMALWRETVK